MQVVETHLTDEHKEILDQQLRQISQRLTIERLSEKIPVIKQMQGLNSELIRLLHHLRVVLVQRNTMQLVLNEDGKNNYGQDEKEALEEINQALHTLDITVARWM